ncbi:hypothetical protein ACFFLM_09395 [Deinococcus oregonensis]|uniref:Uncharacterized protein n=1 Tax=Deinococcus oregonensis TaxID=1805970 RepID=A0ABV6AXD4_9DEIO
MPNFGPNELILMVLMLAVIVGVVMLLKLIGRPTGSSQTTA